MDLMDPMNSIESIDPIEPTGPAGPTGSAGRPGWSSLGGAARRLRRLLSRLPARLLAFNLLLVLVPVGGLFSFGLHELLGRYEHRLLDAQERSMAQQVRLLAAALADVDVDDLKADDAERILTGLEQRLTARLRVYDADGQVLADSARLGPRRDPADQTAEADDEHRSSSPGSSWLYRLGAAPFRLWRSWSPRQEATGTDSEPGDTGPPAEIRSALAGRYGAEARPTPGDPASLTLHVAIPVRAGERIVGAAQASQSTVRILEELRRVRLSFFEVFLASLVGAVLLSVVAAATIARPIRRLRTEAASLVDRRGRLRGTFSGSDSADEVGDLARALENLSRRIERHVRFVESFAADVSHELKNPLTSIRTATELLPDAAGTEERNRLLSTVASDVSRMERLLSAIREISLIDSRLDEEPVATVELGGLLEGLVGAIRTRAPDGVGLRLDRGPESAAPSLDEVPVQVRAAPERIAQVVENLVDNAFGFAPAGSTVEVRLSREEADGDGWSERGGRSGRSSRPDRGEVAVIEVSDRGPGIPPEHFERIFDRFFTYRPAGLTAEATNRPARHTGLGLAIVQAIVDAYGGSVSARNRTGGGACFEVRFPIPSRSTQDAAGRATAGR